MNKFEGDAALCVFGAPAARDDAAGDALARRARAARPARARAPGRRRRHRRVGRAGGGRQRRRRGALRVHGDRRPGQRGGAAVRAGQAARRAVLASAAVLGAPTPTRPSAGSWATRWCCAGARRQTRRGGAALPPEPQGLVSRAHASQRASQGQDLPALRVRGGQGEDQGVRLGRGRGQPGVLRPRAGQGGRLPRRRGPSDVRCGLLRRGRSGRPCWTRTSASTSR